MPKCISTLSDYRSVFKSDIKFIASGSMPISKNEPTIVLNMRKKIEMHSSRSHTRFFVDIKWSHWGKRQAQGRRRTFLDFLIKIPSKIKVICRWMEVDTQYLYLNAPLDMLNINTNSHTEKNESRSENYEYKFMTKLKISRIIVYICFPEWIYCVIMVRC